jgi:hypothetical protein
MGIFAVATNFISSLIRQNLKMIEFGLDSELQMTTNMIFVFGYFIELPLMISIACLCLMAANYLSQTQTKIEATFE